MGWMTTRKCADALGVHIGTVRRWVKRGEVDSDRIGGRIVVWMEDAPHRAESDTAQK